MRNSVSSETSFRTTENYFQISTLSKKSNSENLTVAYSYHFNGVEQESELNSGALFTEFRIVDSRLGRWFSQDPIVKCWESPYAGFANNPIYYKDPSGLDPAPGDPPANPKQDDTYQKTESNGNVWTYTYDAEAGWLGESGSVTGPTITVTSERGSAEGEQTVTLGETSDPDNAVVAFLKAADRWAQGHTKWGFGTTLAGSGAKNTLAVKAAPGAKIWALPEEVSTLAGYAGKSSTTPIGWTERHNLYNHNLTIGQNTGYRDPHKWFDTEHEFPSQKTVIGQPKAGDIYDDVRDNMFVMSGQNHIELTYWVDRNEKITGKHYYFANPHNITLYRRETPIYLSELDTDTPAVK